MKLDMSAEGKHRLITIFLNTWNMLAAEIQHRIHEVYREQIINDLMKQKSM